jgi:putative membrane protein
MKLDQLAEALRSSATFAVLGICIFSATFWLIIKVTPFSIRKEIEQDQNTALAILVASFIIGIAMIVSAAIIG